MEGSGRNDFLMKRHGMHLRLGTVISLQWGCLLDKLVLINRGQGRGPCSWKPRILTP